MKIPTSGGVCQQMGVICPRNPGPVLPTLPRSVPSQPSELFQVFLCHFHQHISIFVVVKEGFTMGFLLPQTLALFISMRLKKR